jgi:hypothetical protein
METKIVDTPLQKGKVSSENVVSQALSMCCFPGNDASLCCSAHALVTDKTEQCCVRREDGLRDK